VDTKRRVPLLAFQVSPQLRQVAARSSALSPRQEEALDSLIGFWTTHERFPSYSELATVLGGVDRSQAFSLVGSLVAKGYLTKEDSHLRWAPATMARVQRLLSVERGEVHEDDVRIYAAFLDRVDH
jgi:hypothetical protein